MDTMTNRSALADAFLAGTQWHRAWRAPLAGDASNRRYERITQSSGSTAVLMDAPPDKGENTDSFVQIARYLCDIGLSAPQILHSDPDNGFLLIEDLGDDLFARVLRADPALETPLYKAAVDALVHLHAHPAPPIERYDAPRTCALAALAYDWYVFGITGHSDTAARDTFIQRFFPLLEAVDQEPPVLIQRDFHAENLLWLPQRAGPARVGLLDFQDAMLGHPAYDLVSILQDARRDVPAPLEADMIRYFLSQTPHRQGSFARAYAVLSVQRNLRILGVFARLCLRDGKPHYVDLIPRVWTYLEASLRQPALAGLGRHLLQDLPPPSPQNLERLKNLCAHHPDR